MTAIRRKREAEPLRTGLHVSTICDDMMKAVEPKRYAKPIDETSVFLFQELGNVIEDVIAGQLAQRLGWVKPPPRQDENGVWGQPDGWGQRSKTVHEVKATWVSERSFVEVDPTGHIVEESHKFWRYRLQGLKYVSMWGGRRLMLHVVFINGMYLPPFPNARTFTMVPTAEDLTRNDRVLKQHAEDRGWL